MVTARLGLVIVSTAPNSRGSQRAQRSLALNNDAVAMARRLGDRDALGLRTERADARAVGHRSRRRSGWPPGPSSGRSPTTSATSSWPCTGTCGASVSCWPRATSTRSTRRSPGSGAGDRSGPPARGLVRLQRRRHDGAAGGRLRHGGAARARRALEVAEGHNDLAAELLRGAHAVDVVAAGRAGRARTTSVPGRDRRRPRPSTPRCRRRWRSSMPRRARPRRHCANLHSLANIGWERMADDQTEGVSLAMARRGLRRDRRAGPPLRRRGSTRRCGPTPARPS